MSTKVVITGFFFLGIFLSGIWLSRTGKPYSMAIFNLHKLIALGAIVFLAFSINAIRLTITFETAQIIAIVTTTACFMITIISGGLISIDKPTPGILAIIHKLGPYLTVLSTAAMLYLLLGKK